MKVRVVRLSESSIGALRAHLRYIQRDGVQRDGSPGLLYSADGEPTEGSKFLKRCANDRHHFRLILSPEDGDQYEDLKPVVRGFMMQMERDLGTRLDWIAADHSDTGHPHSHLILRGKADRGEDLVIAREYIVHGMPERLSERVTQDLGPRQDHEIRQKLRLEVAAERFTSIDRSLENEARSDRVVRCVHDDPFRHALRAARLKKLQALELAEPIGSSQWRLAPELRQQLTAMSERQDIIRTMQRALSVVGIKRAPIEQVVHSTVPERRLVGRLVERGISDEITGRRYAVIDALDGRVHWIELGKDSIDPIGNQAIVSVSPCARSAGECGLPAAVLELLSPVPIEQLAAYDGATWLDEQLDSEAPEPCRNAGFGREVRIAKTMRRQWLLARKFAISEGDDFVFTPGALETLNRRDVANAADRLSKELGLDFVPLADGNVIRGTLARRVDLACGRFALVEDGFHFSIAPWRPVLEQHLGREIEGLVHATNVSWTVSRTPSIEI